MDPLTEQSTAPITPILYDADAEQRIPFSVEFDGEAYEPIYVLGPQTDAALIEYDKQMDRRLRAADKKQSGRRDAMESEDSSVDAGAWLFSDRAVSVEGMGAEGEELPADWKDRIDDSDKADIINTAYLAVGRVPLPVATPGKRLPWGHRSMGTARIPIRALFGGYQLDLVHERENLPPADMKDILGEFNSIRKQTWIVGGTHIGGAGEMIIPPKSQRLAALYDKLGYKATGYAGRVPMHHKAFVVSEDLTPAQEAVTKK
jgi:hypothetical protein